MERSLSRGNLSRSTPSLAAAYNLRQFSADKKRLAGDCTQSLPQIKLEKIDLIGGNGRWRQKMAEEEWARRAIEEEQQRRDQQALEEQRRKRAQRAEERRRTQLQDEENRRQAERERQRREQLEREEAARQAQEKERIRKEEEEQEWLARQPKTCQACGGGGKCPTCSGKGYIFSLFLTPKVTTGTLKDCGRMMEGCEACHGFKQNLLADVKNGTGLCAACDGKGKIWPDPKSLTSPIHRRRTSWSQRDMQTTFCS